MQYERRYAPLVLLALGFGLFVGAIIMAGLNAPPAQVGSLDGGAPNTPPGGIIEATPTPVPLPVEEEMTVIEPVKTAAPQMDLRAYEWAIFTEVNKRRVDAGLQALVWDDRVAAVARFHSFDMATKGYFSHVSPEGVDPWQRLQMAGLPAGSENIKRIEYWDHPRPIEEVQTWMDSEGHRNNILSKGVLRTGVGIAIKGDTIYITQNFIS